MSRIAVTPPKRSRRMLASAIRWLGGVARCSWLSIRPGSRYLPDRSTTRAPGGGERSASGATALIRSPATSTDMPGRIGPPEPSKRLA
jgi:hypothetical protein